MSYTSQDIIAEIKGRHSVPVEALSDHLPVSIADWDDWVLAKRLVAVMEEAEKSVKDLIAFARYADEVCHDERGVGEYTPDHRLAALTETLARLFP